MYCFTIPQILPWSDNVLLSGNFSAEIAKAKEKNRNTID